MKTLSDFNFKGKTVLLRTDINSDVPEGRKKIIESERIKEAAITINELRRKKAKVVVIAHQGKPGKRDFTDLSLHARFLNKYTKIRFVNDIIGTRAKEAIRNLKDGDAILLDNLRFVKDEFNPGKNKLVKTLVELCNIYVNDAFSVCHRKHTSIVSFPKYMKSCSGRVLEREINALKKIKLKDTLYVLGGAKPEDNIKLLKGNKVLACGLFGQACLLAKGKDLGFQNKFLAKVGVDAKLLNIIRKKMNKTRILTPIDFAIKVNGKRQEISVEDFPSKYEIFDIGKKTMQKFSKEIRKAKSIYMKGPAGYATEKQFAKGTEVFLGTIASSKGFSLIGGGHLSDAIKKSGISRKRFGHISLSGGALLNYIAGEKLPGLDVLK
jgi:phosphoglycerate kinase